VNIRLDTLLRLALVLSSLGLIYALWLDDAPSLLAAALTLAVAVTFNVLYRR